MRVILADDAVLFREGTARVLTDAGFEITGQAGDARGLLELIANEPPDVAVIDIRMPPGHSNEGIEAATQIRQLAPTTGLLLLSQHVETHYAMRLMTEFNGGVGYLLKDRVSDLAAFADDVRRVGRGGSVIDPELVNRLVAKKREVDPLDTLTDRERQVWPSWRRDAPTAACHPSSSSAPRPSKPTSGASSQNSTSRSPLTTTAGCSLCWRSFARDFR